VCIVIPVGVLWYDVMTFFLYIYIIYIIRVRVYGNTGTPAVPYFKKRIFKSFFYLIVIVINVIYVYNKYNGFKKVLERPLKACLRHGRPFKGFKRNQHISKNEKNNLST